MFSSLKPNTLALLLNIIGIVLLIPVVKVLFGVSLDKPGTAGSLMVILFAAFIGNSKRKKVKTNQEVLRKTGMEFGLAMLGLIAFGFFIGVLNSLL